MIVAGRVSQKMAPVLRQIYDQMMEPKWVISMGVCASTGGMFNNYAIVQGVDQVVPVDVYAPGCPPGPETLMHADPHAPRADRRRARSPAAREESGGGAGVHVEQRRRPARAGRSHPQEPLMVQEPETQPRSPAPADRDRAASRRPPDRAPHGVPVTMSSGQQVLHPLASRARRPRPRPRDDDGYIMCIDVTAVDYPPIPGAIELPPERRARALRGRRPAAVAMATGDRLRLRVQVPEDDPVVPSLFDVHPGHRGHGARGVRHVRDPLRRPPRPHPHPHAGGLDRPPAAQGLRHRQDPGAVQGRRP